jgi:hypothetical protein
VVVEHPVRTFGDVAGEWAASDDLDFGYRLTLAASGDFVLATDRGKLGTCVLHGHTIVGTAAPKFELEISLDECHRERAAGMIHVAFPSFTGRELVVELTDGGEVTRRTFSAVTSRPGS